MGTLVGLRGSSESKKLRAFSKWAVPRRRHPVHRIGTRSLTGEHAVVYIGPIIIHPWALLACLYFKPFHAPSVLATQLNIEGIKGSGVAIERSPEQTLQITHFSIRRISMKR